VCGEHSLRARGRAKKPNNGGHLRTNLTTRWKRLGSKSALSRRLSPDLRTSVIWYGTGKGVDFTSLSVPRTWRISKVVPGHRERPASNSDCPVG
jgi:hypothetical protein